MSILSFEYLVFLCISVLIWYILGDRVTIKKFPVRNLLLLVCGLFFYTFGTPGGIIILLFAIILSYTAGRLICRQREREAEGSKSREKVLVLLCVLIELSLLFLFKCLDFTLQSFGIRSAQSPVLKWLAPAGLSFFALKTIGYVVDVYRRKTDAETNIINYALFVSFFPTVLSGPIERAGHILPQLEKKRIVDYKDIYHGMRMIISGFFRKMVIADQLALFTDGVFDHAADYSGPVFFLAAIAFTVQIYCDFSGYSEIAIGSARLFGIRVPENFNLPYFARSVKDFWRRWHISLSTWFRDYVYIPLGGSRCSTIRHCLNTLIVFTISGLWHGADWTFILWGGIHGTLLIVESLLHLDKDHELNGHRIITFGMIAFAWIPFRANTLSDLRHILRSMILPNFSSIGIELGMLSELGLDRFWLLMLVVSLGVLIVQDWYRDRYQRKLHEYGEPNTVCSIGFSLLLIVLILLFGAYGPMFSAKDFIYYQF